MEIYEIENVLDLSKDNDLLSVTYQTINLGDGNERGILAVYFEGNSDNAGRTVRYHFKDANGTMFYIFADEIESIETL